VRACGSAKRPACDGTLALPAVCLEALRTHRTRQREERLKADAASKETGLVFTTYAPRGKERTVGGEAYTRGTSCVELVEVSMLLGHSELRVTADLYSHLQKQTAARAAQRMDALLSVKEG
jgi:hypothetical protein